MTNRGAGLTDDQIVAIAKRNGYFRVTLRWRDEKLRKKCFNLKKEGKLGGAHRIEHGAYIFTPIL
ncbi:MAG: hypothetical protein ABW128_16875 [Rhizorhabdus sp.]